MSDTPRNRTQLIRLMNEVIRTGSVETGSIDDEHVALLAEGRLGDLSRDQQDDLLRTVVADPSNAELLKDLCDLGLGGSGKPASSTGHLFGRLPLRVLTGAWAAAACLMIGLGLWRVADPPPVYGPAGVTRPYDAGATGPDYWSQLDRQRLTERASRDRYRDYALVASTTTCLILSVGLVAAVRHRRRSGCRAEPQPPDADL